MKNTSTYTRDIHEMETWNWKLNNLSKLGVTLPNKKKTHTHILAYQFSKTRLEDQHCHWIHQLFPGKQVSPNCSGCYVCGYNLILFSDIYISLWSQAAVSSRQKLRCRTSHYTYIRRWRTESEEERRRERRRRKNGTCCQEAVSVWACLLFFPKTCPFLPPFPLSLLPEVTVL